MIDAGMIKNAANVAGLVEKILRGSATRANTAKKVFGFGGNLATPKSVNRTLGKLLSKVPEGQVGAFNRGVKNLMQGVPLRRTGLEKIVTAPGQGGSTATWGVAADKLDDFMQGIRDNGAISSLGEWIAGTVRGQPPTRFNPFKTWFWGGGKGAQLPDTGTDPKRFIRRMFSDYKGDYPSLELAEGMSNKLMDYFRRTGAKSLKRGEPGIGMSMRDTLDMSRDSDLGNILTGNLKRFIDPTRARTSLDKALAEYF